MSYLVQQLWGTLLLAFAIGAVFGWLLKSWRAVRLQTALRDAGARRDAVQSELNRVRDELKEQRERQRRADSERAAAAAAEKPDAMAVAPVPVPATASPNLLEAQLQSSQQRVAELEARHVEAGAALAARMAEIAVLRAQLEQLRSGPAEHLPVAGTNAPAPAPAESGRSPHDAELLQLREELSRTQQELESLRALLPSAAPVLANITASTRPAQDADDLQRIRGVGPRIAARLHELGIHSYRQIAQADTALLQRLAESLPGFASRVQREDWQGQCLRLHREKYGTAPQ